MGVARYASLDTRELPSRERLAAWNAFGSETLTDMTVDPIDRSAFEARLCRRIIGEIGFVWMESNGAVARQRSAEIGAWASQESVLLTLQDQGDSIFEQSGRQGVLSPGDMVIRGVRRAWTTRVPERMRSVTIKLPVRRLMTRFDDPERVAGQVIHGTSSAARLASALILSVRNSLDQRPEEEWDDTIEEVVLDVVGMAIKSLPSPESDRAACSRLMAEIRQIIEDRLTDPLLNTATIAAAAGVSTRTVQRLFVTVGETPGSYMLGRRLDRAARALADIGHSPSPSITDLAFALGFNDLSHFSRSFARRFGCSPRLYRERPKR